MKKIIIPILLILTIIFINNTYSATTYSGGDVNEDGTTDINDAKLIANYIINKTKPSGFTTDTNVADVNNDSKVKMNDVILIATGKVTASIAPTSISLNKSAVRMDKGSNSTPFTATIAPNNATDKTITWTSSNTSVATVNSSGKVTAVEAGAATITAQTSNGKKATASIIVTKADIYDSYEGTTLKYWIERPTNDYILTRIWVKDAYNQMKATKPVELPLPAHTGYEAIDTCANDANREYDMYALRTANTIISTEIDEMSLQNKALVAINASGVVNPYWVPGSPCSWYGTPPIPYYIWNTQEIRNSTNGKNYGITATTFSSTFGMNDENELQPFYFNKGETDEEIAYNIEKKEEIKKNNVKYTFSFGGYLIRNGQVKDEQMSNQAERQDLCQIDEHNFIILSSTIESDDSETRRTHGLATGETAVILQSYGCKYAMYLDGGGSEVHFYKKNTNELKQLKINGNISYAGRLLGDMLYFVEK